MSTGSFGIVVIGRNEGERLQRCLRSVATASAPVVYVDSASSDGSPERAMTLGATVLPLDVSVPFSAGRARNAGFEKLLELHPGLEFVQFVDGDCEISMGWLEHACAYLRAHADVASVCGRRKERFPEVSVYNALCDIEWDTPVGDAEATGGDFMIRVGVFQTVGGFDERLIAGEEPELCYRVRCLGLRIERLDRPMTLHDAAMTRFGQWAKRSARSGYAYAARAALHWADGRRFGLRENLRIAFWAFVVPSVILVLAVMVSPYAMALAVVYPVQIIRVYVAARRRWPGTPAFSYACFVTLSKWTEFYGQLLFAARTIRGSRQRIIEYK